MVFCSSIQFSVLAYIFISVSSASNNGRQNVRSPKSDEASDCDNDYVYDPTMEACVKEVDMVSCGENMVWKKTESSEDGSCICEYEAKVSGWGRPQILSKTESSCHNLGERGPCRKGRALVPSGRDAVKCDIDACARSEPINAVRRSAWSGMNEDSDAIFEFTYKGECYRTETQGFCGEGHVVRFVVPWKSPVCAPRTEQLTGSGYAFSTDVGLTCGEGLTEDRGRNLCVPVADF